MTGETAFKFPNFPCFIFVPETTHYISSGMLKIMMKHKKIVGTTIQGKKRQLMRNWKMRHQFIHNESFQRLQWRFIQQLRSLMHQVTNCNQRSHKPRRANSQTTCYLLNTCTRNNYNFSDRAFHVAGPWNNLSSDLRPLDLSCSRFRQSLKSFYLGRRTAAECEQCTQFTQRWRLK